MIKYGLPCLAALVLAFAIISIMRSRPVHAVTVPASAPPTAPFESSIGAAGIVEASSENIGVSPPVSGLVMHVYVQAGDRVAKGQKLFRLDDSDLQAELALRRSSLELAEARRAKLLQSPRPEEVAPAEAKVREAEAQYRDAGSQWKLIESVRDPRAIRQEDLLRRRSAAETAEARLAVAKAELALSKAGAWQPDLDITRAQVAEAQRQMERVQADIDRTIVTAPIGGQILQCKIRVGEYAQAGSMAQPALLLGATDPLHVRADVDEHDAWRVHAGAAAVASVRGAAGRRYRLRFVRIEPYVVPKKNLSGDGAERVDTRVLQIVFALEKGAPVYAGQQMDVYIDAAPGGNR